MVTERQSSGVADLDELLGLLIPGDNVVWSTADGSDVVRHFEDAFLTTARQGGLYCCYVTAATKPAEIEERFGSGVDVLDARPRRPDSDPVALEQALVERSREHTRACLVVDELDAFAERWGRTRVATFFTRTCPQLFDNGTIAYWRASRRTLGNAFVEQLTKMTQCVLEVGRHHLRVVKAEGRPASLQGQSVRLQLLDGTVELREERALGRLGRGIERLRQERNLSQTDLARLAGVSASAISQAEAGRRGLSLDTVFVLCERLGIGIDDLLSSATPGYLVARHDRSGRDAPFVGLLDDPGAGLRAYLVRLGPGEAGTPPITHKGVELVLVASGLVRVDLGSETPVMRAGDAALAVRVAVTGWRNLGPSPAVLFWILRD